MSHLLRYLTPDVQARFDAKFVRGNPDECWIWTAAKNLYGYGHMQIPRQEGRVLALAHRIAWTLENQADIPDGLCVMHSCDNPQCVNPAHLSVGTQQDNVKDCMTKLRHSIGQRNGKTKLTEAEVIAIFFDSRPQTQIANDFGIAQQQVSRIKSGQTWRHLGLREKSI